MDTELFTEREQGSLLNKNKEVLGSVSVDSVSVRCPKCYQPYRIYASDVSEPRPKFQCRQCETRFWLPFPEALNKSEQIGFPISWLSIESEENEEDMEVKAKALRQDRAEGVRSTSSLRELWQQVLDDFENSDGHDKFVMAAESQNCMEFAAKRYAELENAMGPDPLLSKMQQRLSILKGSPKQSVSLDRLRARKPKKIRKWWLGFSNIILLMAAIVCVVGMSIPGGKNMVGVGAAIAFFSLSLRLLQTKS